jgi:hypothetical protein
MHVLCCVSVVEGVSFSDHSIEMHNAENHVSFICIDLGS